jgi:hypothetical protein
VSPPFVFYLGVCCLQRTGTPYNARWPCVPLPPSIMVALENATTGAVIPGHEAQRCLLTNVTGLALPIVWGGHPIVPPGITPPPLPAPVKVAPGTMVRLRFLFRDATVFAVGAG